MTDAEAGNEPTGERFADGADRRARVQRIASPDAGDAGGEHERLGRAEQGHRSRERLLAAGRLAEPQRPVPEPLELARIRAVVISREPVATEPSADPSELHRKIVYETLHPFRGRGQTAAIRACAASSAPEVDVRGPM